MAEHCVHLARYFIDEYHYGNALYALLHDASEAYLTDVPSPIKPYLKGYVELEQSVSDAIYNHFGMSTDVPPEIKVADKSILIDEMSQNMVYKPDLPYKALGIELGYWPPERAKREFLSSYDEIMDEIEMLVRHG